MRNTLHYGNRQWRHGPKLSTEIKLSYTDIKFPNDWRSNRATKSSWQSLHCLMKPLVRLLKKYVRMKLSPNKIVVVVQQASSERNSTPARWTWGDIEVSGSDRSKSPAIGRTQVAKATKRWVRIAHVCTAREPPRTDGTIGRTHESAQSKCLC